MENDRLNTCSKILLGRPFLSTASAEIEVRSSLLTMQFDGEIVQFDVYKAIEQSNCITNVSSVNIFEPPMDEYAKHDFSDKLYRNLNFETVKVVKMDDASNMDSRSSCERLSQNLNIMLFQSKEFPSFSHVPNLKIKLPPDKLMSEEDVLLGNTKDLHKHRNSKKKVLSWTKRKKWRNYFSHFPEV